MDDRIYDILGRRIEDLETLPGIAVRLIEMSGDSEVHIGDLAALIEADPATATKILRLANSALYGLPSRISTVREAVMVLGVETVRALALSIAVHMVFESQDEQGGMGDMQMLWQHCIATALCGREIARRVLPEEKEAAFVGGLLHDIGQIVLRQHAPDLYSDVMTSLKASNVPLQQAEREIMGFDHAQVGEWVLRRWRFPLKLCLSVGLHHEDPLPVLDEDAVAAVPVVQVANWLASIQGLGSPWQRHFGLEAPSSTASIALDDETLVRLCLGLDQRVSQVCKAIGLRGVSSDVFQRALYDANRALTQLAVGQDRRNKELQHTVETLSLWREISEALARSDGLSSVLEAYLEAICSSGWVEYLQLMVPVSSEEVMIGTGHIAADGRVRTEVVRSTYSEWVRSKELRSDSAAYVHQTFRLLNGSRGELLARLDGGRGEKGNLDLGPFLAVLSMAVERALADEHVALISERLRDRASTTAGREAEGIVEGDFQDRRLRMLGELAAGAAHDLNNALAVVLGQTQLGLLAESVEEAREYLATIERTTKDCASTVRRLQEFARGSRQGNRASTVNLSEVAREVVKVTRPRWRDEAQRQGVTIQAVVDLPECLPVRGDAAALREALTNLVFNAIDAMPSGGTLAVRGWNEAGKVYLAIRDTGIGIPKGMKERIFEPFFTTKGERGTGLGLAVCKRIIEEHGGEISVRSRPGMGAAFIISLPLESDMGMTRERETASQPEAFLRVLLIDDEPEVRQVLTRLLEIDGHVLTSAATALEGMRLFGEGEFDVVMTDLGLPDSPGAELARQIKEMSPGTRLILISGWTEDVEEIGAHVQADAILSKPFGIMELREALSAAMTAGRGAEGAAPNV